MKKIFSIIYDNARDCGNKPAIITAEKVCTYSDVILQMEILNASTHIRGKSIPCLYYGRDAIDLAVVMLVALKNECPLIVCQPEKIFLEAVVRELKPLFFVRDKQTHADLSLTFPDADIQRMDEPNADIKFPPRERNFHEDADFIIYTSGSTGRPQGIVHSETSFILNIEDITEQLGLNMINNFAICNSIFTSYGFAVGILLSLVIQKTIEVLEFDYPDRLIKKLCCYNEACFITNPAVLKKIIDFDCHVSQKLEKAIAMIISSGALLPEECFNGFLHSDIRVADVYGSTEANAVAVKCDSFNNPFRKFNSIEPKTIMVTPHGDTEMRYPVLALKSPKLMLGFIGEYVIESPQIVDEWLMTADIVEMEDDNQSFRLVGRVSSLMKINGNRVQAEVIEASIEKIEGIKNALVYLRKHESVGEILCAKIVLKPGSQPEMPDILNRLSTFLPAHMIPRTFEVVGEIETNNGKKIRGVYHI